MDAVWGRGVRFVKELKRPSVLITHAITSRVLRIITLGPGPQDLRDALGGQRVVFRVMKK